MNTPITEEMLQTYHDVTARIDHVCSILSKYRPLFKTQVKSIDVTSKDVYCEFEIYSLGYFTREEDEFPVAYLAQTDEEIRSDEQFLKEKREEAELKLKEKREAARLAEKRAAFEKLKKELGE